MQDLVKTPEKSVMIVYNVFHDNRLAKNPTKRLRTAFIYGLLRRTFNNSLNHLDKFYSKKYGTVYCVNQIATLIHRSGFKRNTIINSFKSLNKYGYIDTEYNPHRHVNFIFMPKVMANEIKDENIFNGVGLKNKPSRFKKSTNVGLKNKLRCSEHNNNEHNVSTYRQTPKHIKIMVGQIKHYDYPKNVNDLIIKRCSNYDEARDLASDISNIKVSINQEHYINHHMNLYDNKNNNYIQNGDLFKLLSNAFDNGKNPKEAFSSDYESYVTNFKKHQHHHNYSHKSVKPKYNKYDKELLNDTPDDLHPTNKKLQRKIQKQLNGYKVKDQKRNGTDKQDVSNKPSKPNDNKQDNDTDDPFSNVTDIFSKSPKEIDIDENNKKIKKINNYLSHYLKDYPIHQDTIVDPSNSDFDGRSISDLKTKVNDLKHTNKQLKNEPEPTEE